MLSQFVIGIKSGPSAVGFIREQRLWFFILFPGMISILILGTLLYLGLSFLPGLIGTLILKIPFLGGIEWIGKVITLLSWTFSIVLSLLTYRYFVLIFMSPILSYLSELVDNRITGKPSPSFSFTQLVSDIVRALKINIRNLFRELIITVLLYLIPGINVLAPFLSFIVQSYYTGFGILDYTLERKRFSPSETKSYVWDNKGLAIGIGMGFNLINLIPVFGWGLAPTLYTIGGTREVLKRGIS